MITIIKKENYNYVNWKLLYLKNKKFFCLKIFSLLFFSKKGQMSFLEDTLQTKNKTYRFIGTNFGFDTSVLIFNESHKIGNYVISKCLIDLKNNGFDVSVVKVFELGDFYFYIKIYKNKDLLLEMNLCSDDLNSDFSDYKHEIKKIKKGIIIMSKEKEKAIIKEISIELNKYDISLSNYEFLIEENLNDTYDVSLEQYETKKMILIKNVKIDENNKIISLGLNNGLVL